MADAPVIRAECLVHASPEAIFDAFVVPERLTEWFAAREAEIDPQPNGAWRFAHAPGRYSSGTFASLDRPRSLVLRWNEWHEDETGTPLPGADTSVVSTCMIEIQPEGNVTRVRVVQEGYPDTPEWHDLAGALTDGWSVQLRQLKQYVEEDEQ